MPVEPRWREGGGRFWSLWPSGEETLEHGPSLGCVLPSICTSHSLSPFPPSSLSPSSSSLSPSPSPSLSSSLPPGDGGGRGHGVRDSQEGVWGGSPQLSGGHRPGEERDRRPHQPALQVRRQGMLIYPTPKIPSWLLPPRYHSCTQGTWTIPATQTMPGWRLLYSISMTTQVSAHTHHQSYLPTLPLSLEPTIGQHVGQGLHNKAHLHWAHSVYNVLLANSNSKSK